MGFYPSENLKKKSLAKVEFFKEKGHSLAFQIMVSKSLVKMTIFLM